MRNVIERAVALCAGKEIGLEDLPVALRSSGSPVRANQACPAVDGYVQTGALARTKEAAEAQRILSALQRNNNNRLRAAVELGISRMTLYKKLHRYGLMSST